MSYHLHRDETLGAGVRRVAVSQLDRAIREIEDPQLGRNKTVHQVRKRCKKLRGLLRLVRPGMEKTYKTENAAFRNAARTLSEIRDAKSIIATYDSVMQRFTAQVDRRSFATVRRELTRRLKAVDTAMIDERLRSMREDLIAAKTRVADWKLSEEKFNVAAAGISKTRRRAAKGLRAAHQDPTTENLHELRKRIKYHWYHLRLLRELWPPATKPLRKAACRLGDCLGDDHDLAVFAETVRSDPQDFGSHNDARVLDGLIDQNRQLLRRDGLRQAEYLLAESTDAFAKRMDTYWQLWTREDT